MSYLHPLRVGCSIATLWGQALVVGRGMCLGLWNISPTTLGRLEGHNERHGFPSAGSLPFPSLDVLLNLLSHL